MKPNPTLFLLLFHALPLPAQEPLWVGATDLSKNGNAPFLETSHRIMDERTEGEYQFTIGADIVFHDGEFVVQWANRKKDDNEAESLVRGRL